MLDPGGRVIGRSIGNWQILRQLGEGASGVVYEAQNTTIAIDYPRRVNRLALALALALAFVVGCAHGPPLDSHDAAPGDHRAVLVEFWASWCEPCRRFEREFLPHPEVQRALAGVRFVRYDVDSRTGAEAYRRLTRRTQTRVPLFLGLSEQGIVSQAQGLPSQMERFIEFVDDLAQVGGSEGALKEALALAPDEPTQLMRAGRWYAARKRGPEASAWFARVAALPDAPEALRAEADWQLGVLLRKGAPRDPRAPLAFVLAHPSSPRVHIALDILAVISNVSASEVASALRAAFEAHRNDGNEVNDLAYHALAAHQYDLALELAQQAMRRLKSAAVWDTLAEVYYYRHETAMALAMAQHAVALMPNDATLRQNLERFRRADGTPCDVVENLRSNGLFALPRFYGDVD